VSFLFPIFVKTTYGTPFLEYISFIEQVSLQIPLVITFLFAVR
jgi:hypothetical protein